MAPDVARVLAQLGERERFTGDDDLVSLVKSADTSTGQRFGAGTTRRSGAPAYVRSTSTTCATPSARG
jgi:hypothetical protein